MGKLTALEISRPMKPGMHADGDGLYLQVAGTYARSWIYRYSLNGRTRDLGLGSAGANAISLKLARELAAKARQLRAQGIDPVERRRAERVTERVESAKAMTFAQCARAYIDTHEATWHNAKHRQQWANTLATYAYPLIGTLPVKDIDTGLVLKVLNPLWNTKPETASRLRGRIEVVLDWAKVAGYRDGPNPAAWRGHLEHSLPARSKVRAVKHHAALPYAEIPAFMVELRERTSTSARCLEFTILTAARTSEAIGARWDEVDFATRVWTIPAARMKAGRQHRVPLSGRAVAILHELSERREGEFIFPGGRAGRPLSNMAMLKMLALLGRDDLTTHGFRSSLRDWASETTSFPHEVCEMALAHAVGDKVEAAYRRGDLFEKRRKLMESWAQYCAKPATDGKVLALRSVS
jgi:integrase